MKLTNKLAIAILLTVAVTAISSAQQAGATGGTLTQPKAAHGHHPFEAALNGVPGVTDAQKSQIKALIATRASDNKSFRKANKGDAAAIKAHNKEENEKLITGIKGVLTADQFKQFEANLKALRGKHGKGSATPTPPQVKP